MPRKIVRLIKIVLLAFCLIFLESFYLPVPETQQSRDNAPLDNKLPNRFLLIKKLPQANEEVTFLAVGDISYSRSVERTVKKLNDIYYPFRRIGSYLKSADIVFGNLETPITPGAEIPNFAMIFRSNPGTEQALKQAGFSILSLANNHTPNFGEQGLKDTFNYLAKVGIKYVGAGQNESEAYQPVFAEVKGVKLAFLAYNDTDVAPKSYEARNNRAGTAFMRLDKMAQVVKAAKEKVNFVIVSMHAGTEYAEKPNNSQIRFAHAAVDAGADLIIGHHPHVIQTMEEYRGKYIFYSLGNFIFDQPWVPETKESLMVKVDLTKRGIKRITLLPVAMNNYVQPEIVINNGAARIWQRLKAAVVNRIAYLWSNRRFGKSLRAGVKVKNREIAATKQESADLDNNAIPENYYLENGRLTIVENSKIVWQSPPDWRIDNFVLADSNNDKLLDLNLSLWKAGNYGPSKPFWVKEDDRSVKNHFFVLDYVNGEIKQIWGSSNLSVPNCEFQIADVDGDGKNDLIVVEGDYTGNPAVHGNYVAVWEWNGWGFSNEWRSERGQYANLEIEKNDQKSYIVVDTM